MTLKYFCDRCDFYIEDGKERFYDFHIQVRPPKLRKTNDKDITHDLCIDCFKDFQKFMKRDMKK